MFEHSEALEADFQRYYRLDLLDVWRGRISLRKASVLARNLPAGAQTWVSCGFDNAWTMGEHLSALTVDVLSAANWQRAGDSKATRPKPIPRPSDARRSVEAADRNDIRARAFLDRQRRAQAVQQPQEEV